MTTDEPLHYSIGDEDNRLEWALLHRRARHVVTVAGSGARLLPLLARRPRRLTALDLSLIQLALTHLRIAALRSWNHEIYCAFFGYPPHSMIPAERHARFEGLPLPETTLALLRPLFRAHGFSDVAYYGSFEQTLVRTARLVRVLLGPDGPCLFEAQGIDEQRQLLQERFPWQRWQLVLSLLSHDDELRALLSHGAFASSADTAAAFHHFDRLFRHLFHDTLVRESFFLQLLFFGRIEYPEGLPVEAHPLIFEAARAALSHTELTIAHGDITQWLQCHDGVDFVSLSHANSVLDGQPETSFLDHIHGSLLPGSRVVTRGHPHGGRLQTAGYHLAMDDHRAVLRSEATQLWHVHVYRRQLAA